MKVYEPEKVVVPSHVAKFIEGGNPYKQIACLAHHKYLGIISRHERMSC